MVGLSGLKDHGQMESKPAQERISTYIRPWKVLAPKMSPRLRKGLPPGNNKTAFGRASSPARSKRDLSFITKAAPHKVVSLMCHQSLLRIGFSISMIRGIGS